MYRNSYMTKSFWSMGTTSFSVWPMAAILNFKIRLVPLDNSFPVPLYQRGSLDHDLPIILHLTSLL